MLSLIAVALCFVHSLLTVLATTFPDPLPIKGPFFFVHDPSLVQRDDGKYFLFTTHDKAGIITADRLEGPWTVVGSILPNNSTIDLPGRDDIWAPDVSLHNGLFHAYYSVSTFGSQDSGIGLATSKTLEPGSWTDKGLVIRSFTGGAFNAIDPNLVIGDGGVPLLSFGSFWNDSFQVHLGPDLQTPVTDPLHLSFNSSSPNAEEGSFVWKQGEFYYLFISAGLCCGFDANALPPPGEEYRVIVGRSRSASGPFLDRSGVDMRDSGGTTVLGSHGNVYAPGGQVIFFDKRLKKEVFVYHYVPAINSPDPFNDTFSSLGLNGIDWHSGWPVLTELKI